MNGLPLQAKFRLAVSKQITLLSVSTGTEALLGFSADDFLAGRVNLRERIHADDADIAGILFSSNNAEKSGTFNIRVRHADGRIRCLRGNFNRGPVRDGQIRILELLLEDAKSLHRNGTEPARLTTIEPMMEFVGEALYFKNRDHVFTSLNHAAELAFAGNKGSREGLIGQTDYDLFPETYADVSYRLEKEVLAGATIATEIQLLPAEAQPKKWLNSLKYAVRGPDGEVIGLFGVAHDITGYRETQERLRESEEMLRDAQIIAGLGTYRMDMRSGAWTSSDVLDRIFGIEKGFERTFAGWMTIVHPDDRVMMADYFTREVVDQVRPVDFDNEYRIVRHSDGAVRWVQCLGRLEVDSQGRPEKMLGTIRDITRGKQGDLALRESRELLRLFIEHAPAAIAMLDREMRYLAVSRRWLDIHALEGQELIGRSHYEIFPHLPRSWAELHQRALAGETAQRGEDRLQRADGSMRWVRRELRPWFTGDGTIGGIIIFSEDITERKQADAALRENKELLQLFVDHAPVAIAMFDREMRYLSASRRWIEDYALTGQQFIGRSHYQIVSDIPERWKAAHLRGLAGETLRSDEEAFERADGTVQWIRWEIVPWREGTGSVGGIIVFAEDITRHRETEQRLRLAATVFTNAREGITITDLDGTILEVNDMFTKITGYERAEVLGKNPRLLKSGVQSAEFYANMRRSLVSDGHWSGEIWNRNKSGEVYAEMLTINAVRDAAGKVLHYVALFSDITQLKKQAQVLEHIVHFDVLTSLPNRSLLVDRLHQAMAQANRRKQYLAVAYLDLDGFKTINDQHGREAGDRLLTSLAFDMKCALREGDTLARLGGDEFVAVILDLDDAAASVPVLDQLREAAAEIIQVGDLSLSVSASIGVTFYPQLEDADPDLLLRQADQAMYQAKLAGGNRYHIFDPEHDQTVRGRHENLEHIRRALAAREFVLHYQPKVNMRTGKVVGLEALIRWQHRERGLLPPGMFLPVIEDHLLTIELGEWVIDSVLSQMESWRAGGLEIPVSVNVGALQLQQPDFVDRLSRMLAAHPSLKPFSLEIEVLETSALQDVAQTSQVLNACHSIGVLFALDDFGAGYASLTYLKRLPASTLKIDQSFVSDMLDEPENLNILEGILSLASAFHRQVIAEGVESVQHGLMLLQLGCELAQGYGIARPMPASEIPAWISGWKPDPRWAEVPSVHAGNKALLYACVEHRSWLAAFEAFLMGKRHALPPMDERQCQLGKWLEAEALAGRGNERGCRTVDIAHGQFHDLAVKILLAHSHGRSSEGVGRLGELHEMCDRFLQELEMIRRGG